MDDISLGDIVQDEQGKVGILSGILTNPDGSKKYIVSYPPEFPWNDWSTRELNRVAITRFYNQEEEKGDFYE